MFVKHQVPNNSRTPVAQTPLVPWKFVLDRGNSSHWKLIIALVHETNGRQFRDVFPIFYEIILCWVYSLESSNEYTQHIFYDKEIFPKMVLHICFHELSELFPRDSKMSSNYSRRTSHPCSSHCTTKTCLYNFDPLKPHFYIVKLGLTGVYIIFLISA